MSLQSIIWIGLVGLSYDSGVVVSVEQKVVLVQTHRSDGAIFPAVKQTKRVQRQRQVRVSGSRQALPAPQVHSAMQEPSRGGLFVAPADDALALTGQTLPTVIFVPSVLENSKAGKSNRRD